jgi:hypothetical protein
MTIRRNASKWLQKKAKTGRGRPIEAIAFYGPDQQHATKVVAAVLQSPDEDPLDLRRNGDTLGEITSVFKSHGVRSVAMIDRVAHMRRAPTIRWRTLSCMPLLGQTGSLDGIARNLRRPENRPGLLKPMAPARLAGRIDH